MARTTLRVSGTAGAFSLAVTVAAQGVENLCTFPDFPAWKTMISVCVALTACFPQGSLHRVWGVLPLRLRASSICGEVLSLLSMFPVHAHSALAG